MKISNRTLWVSLIFLATMAAGAYATLQSVASIETAEMIAAQRFYVAQKQYEETVGVIEKLVQKASTVDDWKDVLARAGSLPKDAKEYFTKVGTIGMLEALAGERDRLLVNASELLAANEKDPSVKNILEKAKDLHELADATVQKLPADPKNLDWQLSLHYRKAYEKYRSLVFLDEKEHNEALQIIDEAMSELRSANAIVPKNIKVEFADEFLYKRAKEEESKRGEPKPTGARPRALPSHTGRLPGQGPGIGPNREKRF